MADEKTREFTPLHSIEAIENAEDRLLDDLRSGKVDVETGKCLARMLKNSRQLLRYCAQARKMQAQILAAVRSGQIDPKSAQRMLRLVEPLLAVVERQID